MVAVNLWSGLRRFADGQQVVEVEASTVGEVLQELVKAHPGLDPVIQAGVSVSVDDEIVQRALNHPVQPDSEVFLLQQFRGG